MQNSVYIYGLKEPHTEQIRYVGKSNTPEIRLKGHLAEKGNTRKNNWLKSLKSKGLKPDLEIIDQVPANEWQEWEKHYIMLFKSMGARLVNGTEGGEDIGNLRKPVLQYTLQGKFVKRYDSATGAAEILRVGKTSIFDCCRGEIKSAYGFIWKYEGSQKEIIAVIPQARKVACYNLEGHLISLYESASKAANETKANRTTLINCCNNKVGRAGQYMFKYYEVEFPYSIEPYRDTRIGRKRSKDVCQKISESRKGMKFSEETKTKMSKARKGMKYTEERKAQISERVKGEGNSFYGKTHTEATKRKISESQKKRFNNLKIR